MALATLTRPLAIRPLPATASRRVAVCVRAAAADKPDSAKAVGKAVLVDAIAEEAGITREQASKAFDATFDGIANALYDGARVTVVGFGSFEVRQRAERHGRNPSTGAPMTIPAMKTVGFRVSPTFKAGVNGGQKPVTPKPAAKPAAAKPAAAKPAAAKPAAAKPAAAKPAAAGPAAKPAAVAPAAAKKAAPPKAAPKK